MLGRRVFVTGGAGFIGSNIVDRLFQEGAAQVTVYDNLRSGHKGLLQQHWTKPNFRFVQADLMDLEQLKAAMKGHDFVFHMAANPDIKFVATRTDVDLQQGTIATYNVLEAMRENGVGAMAFSSSSVIYGQPTVIPTPEDYGPLLPISLYGASKLACEGLIAAYSHLFQTSVWIFRFANIVGPRQTHGLIVDLLAKLKMDPYNLEILGDGKQKKSYLLVDECVEGMFYAIQHCGEGLNVFNLGSQDSLTVDRIVQILLEEGGYRNVALRYSGGDRGWPGDVPLMLLDVSRINRLGWKAHLTSEEAIRIAIQRLLRCR
ncbi:MAG: NAD-dependent epimerase/dehydratase family protein [Chloroflexi bacterium]|nr:NAD-dependent epimerase/dehydratase family protein [Chloroflexota bacterium]